VKNRSQTATSGLALVILVLFYILLVSLIIIFFQDIIENISAGRTLPIIFIASVIPIVLLGVITFNILRLIRERARKRAGARLKTRLLALFTLVALLAVVPQALLSITFINKTIDAWVSSDIGSALEGGVTVSLAYRADKDSNLNRFSQSPMLASLLAPLAREPQRAWNAVRQANPEINLFQVFDAEGAEIIYRGPEEGRTEDVEDLLREEDLLRRHQVKGGISILKVMLTQSIEGRDYHVILGITYPKSLDEHASLLTETRSLFASLFRFRAMFRVALALFYLLFSIPIFLLIILVSFLLTDEIIRPVANLEEATRRLAEGDFSFRILTRSRDELGVLAASFNRMIAELENSRNKLIQAEKISAWKEIAQRFAHEIKNPLTPIKLSAQRVLRKHRTEPKKLGEVLEPAVTAIISEVDNLNKLLEDFREFTKLPVPSPEPTDMKKLIREVVSVYEHLSQTVVIQSRFLHDDTPVDVDRNQMKQVFANLIKNAVQAMPDGGEISILTELVKKNDTRYFRTRIRDTGGGMDDEYRHMVFEPYFTTKKGGVGLGLSIVERIVFDHNGNIWFETQKGSGTTFYVDLPLKT
jgi:nitrogen fixation/metabolism regulation signal transduction histidine kinase